jgi:hypothetical protein
MLKPEQVQKILDEQRLKDIEQYQLAAIAGLPEPLRPISFGFLQRDAEGQPIKQDYQRRREVYQQAFTQLPALDAADRLRIFAVFFPQLAPAIELAWQRLAKLPYQVGYAALLFRAPQRPDLLAERQQSWLAPLMNGLSAYHQDIIWLAHYAAYIGGGYLSKALGVLFAAVIDEDQEHGDAIFTILVDSAKGEDEIGTMGRHIPQALLGAARPDGWEFIGKLLLAAQRQEGLRQIVLEGLDDAHPQAFHYLLRLIVENDLARFSSVTLMLNSWLGCQWDSAQKAAITRMLQRLLTMLEDAQAREAALAEGNGEEVYLALWAIALDDVLIAIERAAAFVQDAAVERRFAAVHLLAQTALPEAAPALMAALGDADVRVLARACQGLEAILDNRAVDPALPIFEQVEALLPRLSTHAPASTPIIWEWLAPSLERERVANLLIKYLGDRDPRQLLPYLSLLGQYHRVQIAGLLAEKGNRDLEIRAALLLLLRDRSAWVSDAIVKLLDKHGLEVAEIPQLEALLTRKSAGLRRGLLDLLIKQTDDVVLAAADRLTYSHNDQQRLAGLELLRVLHEQQRSSQGCMERAAAYRESRKKLSPSETILLDPILDALHEKPTLANALGLANPAECAQVAAPLAPPVQLHPARAMANLKALDALVHEHRNQSYSADTWQGKQEMLLGANAWAFPQPQAGEPLDQEVARLPLASVWRAWAEQLQSVQGDEDGLHLVRMQIASKQLADDASAMPDNSEQDFGKLRYPHIVLALCSWLTRLYPAPATADFLLDYVETILAALPAEYLREPATDEEPQSFYHTPMYRAIALVRTYAATREALWNDAHAARLWRLLRWTMALKREGLQLPPTLHETLEALRVGEATEADLLMQLLGTRPLSRYGSANFPELRELSARKPHPFFTQYPVLHTIYANCLRRILEVELHRGEMPTEATPAALNLRAIVGADWFIRILQALDALHLKRGYSYLNDGKARTLSHLLRVSFPGPDETPELFVTRAKAARLTTQQLIEAAVYAPQWAHFIEQVLGWRSFADAVWWIHAHTRERNWYVDQAIREYWEAQIAERTPLTGSDLYDGAVDVAWFRRVYAALGKSRWEMLYQAAKYSSGGIGHTRAQLFADAMLGLLKAKEVIRRIQTKRHQYSVCALGLLPLPKKQRDQTILRRYQVFQEFLRTSRAFGAQRRESEGKVARIGLENLARTAGYSDPLRFQWAMELQEVADLRAGPITVIRDGVSLTLRINPVGQPLLEVTRNGKLLKQIPPRLKKETDVIALRERKQSLERQLSRMRLALEQAMCREESWTAEELKALLGHPMLAPMLEQLIFVGDSALGYLVEGGRVLRLHDGRVLPLAGEMSLRIAHPYDLYRSGDWSQWQRECFISERIQPFKQIFRELYVLTEAEKRDGAVSHRYAGQQIQPRQAMALLGQRGWISSEYDDPSRTFHERGLTASITYLAGGYTSVEVEGLTLDGVLFNKIGEWRGALPLAEVPPVVFSETMRDLDLVASVAHRGGVDPESSASTVEMRAALIRETSSLLGLTNVQLQPTHAIVTGELGEYSLHLGSGVVHLILGGALCIIPVHAQHRGRLFLPFADDDPKTAEIVSKILLLSRDSEIKDPLILQQMYARV